MNPIMPFSRQSSYSKGTFIFAVNPLMPVDNKKAHTYLDKPAAERSAFSCKFVSVSVTFLLPPGIKGLSLT